MPPAAHNPGRKAMLKPRLQESDLEKISSSALGIILGLAVRQISFEDLPVKVQKFFEKNSILYIPREAYKPKNFYAILEVRRATTSFVTYAAMQTKTIRPDETFDELTEENTYFADYESLCPEISGILGYAELRRVLSFPSEEEERFKDKPFVRHNVTCTPDDKCWALRMDISRLELMHLFCKVLYDRPLYSDILISKDELRSWNKLLALKRARMFKEFKDWKYDRFFMLG